LDPVADLGHVVLGVAGLLAGLLAARSRVAFVVGGHGQHAFP
jgi:hypothetical protein